LQNHAVLWHSGAEKYEVFINSNVLRDQQQCIVGAYVIFKDVSNLRSLEEYVQRSDRLAMIGKIAAGTAHEIRNPLTSIKGFLQMFKGKLDKKGMDKEVHYTEIMLREINRINELVGEFLLLGKPKHVTLEKINLCEMINDIMPIIRSEAIFRGVRAQHEAGDRVPNIIADRELLKQVFINIAKNGIEAMVDGGMLTIHVKNEAVRARVIVDIHDTGPGIPTFLMDKVFDPFFTTKQNGTGLGLSVCQQIIQDLGGSIQVSSKGFGTTFTLAIPY